MKALVLSGDGLNCEQETAKAFSYVGLESDIVCIQDLMQNPKKLHEYRILAIPGGFSFGDEVHSGQILALKIKHYLIEDLKTFLQGPNLILGICNGFQVLVKLGLLPYPFETRILSLTHNSQGHFINRWVDLKNQSKHCIWTQGVDSFSMPIRHGEGRIQFLQKEKQHLAELREKGLIALTYIEDVNGSAAQIAALTDPSGKILGLMPHPEAALFSHLNPKLNNTLDFTSNIKIFENAKNFILQESNATTRS